MKNTRKLSIKRKFWEWFPLCFNICILVLAIINIFTESELLKSIIWAMIYIVPWFLFIQARSEANDHWDAWCREANTVCNYMNAQSRIFIMLHNVEDEKIRARLIKEYGAIVKECILEDEENETSKL